jgi:hypothetical protein
MSYLAMLFNPRYHVVKNTIVAGFIFSSIVLFSWYSRDKTEAWYQIRQKSGSISDVRNQTLGVPLRILL